MTIRIPIPSSMLVSNLLGVAGLAAVVVAIGLLAGFPWALLAAGVISVGLCALAQNAGDDDPQRDRAAAVHQLLHTPPAPAGGRPDLNGAVFEPARTRQTV